MKEGLSRFAILMGTVLFVTIAMGYITAGQSEDGKELFKSKCAACHAYQIALNQVGKKTGDQWDATVKRMRGMGVPGDISDDDAKIIINYLKGLGMVGVSATPLMAKDIAAEAPRITKEGLKPMLGDPDLIIIDVLVQDQWEAVDQKIPGAVHENPEEVDSWADKYPKDKSYVLYSALPGEVTSARVAMQLIDRGFQDVYALQGGLRRWTKAKYPTEIKYVVR